MAQGDPCERCGAPHVSGYAACKYCKAPYPTDPDRPAVPCPRCATLSEWGSQKCVSCQAWIVVKCVFCGALSPHSVPSCLKCNEAFAGAPERLRQRQEAASRQQTMQVVGQVGSVAAQFLGAAAGAAAFGSRGSSVGWQRNGDGRDWDGDRHHHQHHGRDDGGYRGEAQYQQPNQGGGIMDSLFGDSSSSGGASADYGSSEYAEPPQQNQGGGIMDALFSDSSSSSTDTSSNSGGGIMDALFSDSGGSSDSGEDS